MARDPKKINSFIVIDFENGGIDKQEGVHCRKHPLTEFAGIAIHGVTLEKIVAYENLIKPYDNALTYDPVATQITGITKEMCEKDGVPLRQVVDDICTLIDEANIHNSKTARPIFVAHNWDFERQYLMDIFKRAGRDLSKYVDGGKDNQGNFVPTGIDTVDLAKQCWAEITETTTKFKLAPCCQRAGVDQADGHRAMNDVIPTVDLFRYFITRLRSGSSAVKVEGGQISIHRQSFEW